MLRAIPDILSAAHIHTAEIFLSNANSQCGVVALPGILPPATLSLPATVQVVDPKGSTLRGADFVLDRRGARASASVSRATTPLSSISASDDRWFDWDDLEAQEEIPGLVDADSCDGFWDDHARRIPRQARAALRRMLADAPARAAFAAAMEAERDRLDKIDDEYDMSVSPHRAKSACFAAMGPLGSDAELPLITDDARHGELHNTTGPGPDPQRRNLKRRLSSTSSDAAAREVAAQSETTETLEFSSGTAATSALRAQWMGPDAVSHGHRLRGRRDGAAELVVPISQAA